MTAVQPCVPLARVAESCLTGISVQASYGNNAKTTHRDGRD